MPSRLDTQEKRDAYNARRREEWAKHADTINAYKRWRYANDPEYRAMRLESAHKHYNTDEYKEKKRERDRRYKEAHREERNAKLRERYATDTEYRERRLEYNRTHRAKRAES